MYYEPQLKLYDSLYWWFTVFALFSLYYSISHDSWICFFNLIFFFILNTYCFIFNASHWGENLIIMDDVSLIPSKATFVLLFRPALHLIFVCLKSRAAQPWPLICFLLTDYYALILLYIVLKVRFLHAPVTILGLLLLRVTS